VQLKAVKMAYSDFKLDGIIQKFDLTINEVSGLFSGIPEEECSDLLTTILQESTNLAISINTEKARSEMIIAPILLEVRRKFNYEISLFSGVEFNVDIQQGLNGFCDFLLSLSKEQLLINVPIIILVETKNENLKSGLAQCLAEMVAAQLFNQQKQNHIQTIYGIVTIGTIWQFLKLENKVISIDLDEYYIKDVKKILGILIDAVRQSLLH
jgi:hypothetical protein